MGSDIQLRRDELGPDNTDGRNAREERAAAISRGNRNLDTLGEEPRTFDQTKSDVSSPLGKLFSPSATSTAALGETQNGTHDNKSGQAGEDLVRTHAEEFDELRRQLDAMKDGQERVEAMLRRLTSAGNPQ